jgi:hypothetical protein
VKKTLKRLCIAVGIDPARYKPHSLRIGGCTLLAEIGAPDEVVCALGRWRSEVHRLYMRVARRVAFTWARAMALTGWR